MFYHLLYPLNEYVSAFNLFKYITVRSGGALFTAFCITLLCGPWFIDKMRSWQRQLKGGTVKDVAHTEAQRAAKAGTPSMGGLLLVASLLVSVFLWADLSTPYVWMLVGVILTFATIGFTDDYLNLSKQWKNGLPGKVRLAIQMSVAALVVYLFTAVHVGGDATTVFIPFFKDFALELGLAGFILFGALVMTGSANAVNLTDGLDGLVSIPAVIVAATLATIAYIVGRIDFTQYLGIAYVPGAGEIAVVMSALVGACLGFLWFNAPPARVFMGDTGSLAIGGLLGAVAVLLKQELVLVIIGGLFVLETVSVIVQVVSFKLTGRRVFRMAPLHHHFEQLGWPETTIVIRFWIIALLLAIIGLATLKLR